MLKPKLWASLKVWTHLENVMWLNIGKEESPVNSFYISAIGESVHSDEWKGEIIIQIYQ